MHVLYDIEEKDLTLIPGSRHLRRGPDGAITRCSPQGTQPAWKSMEDGNGHMVVAVNYNTDIGDAWEFADVPVLSRENDRAGLPLRHQLRGLRDDALMAFGVE